MPRVIAHLDMDAFYASVELLRYPMLRGQAVVVGGGRRHTPVQHEDGSWTFSKLGDYVGRGVVTTSTYEARAFGVFSAMGMMKAAALAPHAVLLPMDFDSYRLYSRKFKAAVAELAPVIEDRGIDEIYIDLTDVPGIRDTIGHDPLGGVRAFAHELKNNVKRATGLTCSVGVTPNKLLSKIASELDKPNGLTVLTMDDVATRIWPLPVRRINGIGPKAGAKLDTLGIHTVGELAARDMAWLTTHFTQRTAQWLWDVSHGVDDRPIVTESEPVSMSRETTFDRDLHAVRDRAQLTAIFTQLCHQVAADLARKGYVGRTVGIKLRFDDFRTVTRDQSVPATEATCDPDAIRRLAGLCLKRVDLSRRLRLLGVRVGGLSRPRAAGSGPATGPGGRARAEARPRAGAPGSAAAPDPAPTAASAPDEPTLF